MTDYTHKRQGGRECPPDVNPADQPKQPTDGKECECLPKTTPPTLNDPEKCPDPPPYCKCPKKPPTTSNCLEDLIAEQAAEILVAEKAKAFKTDLEKLLDNAKKAEGAYTQDNYLKLVDDWWKQDKEIAELIPKLVCAVPCWRCILECYVCPLLNELHYAEERLYYGEPYTEVHNLYDLQYWLQRDVDAKKRRFDRIDRVMRAWGSPKENIEAALGRNKKLIDDVGKLIGSQPVKVIYDVFFQLVPMHLAIAPPAVDPRTTTRIDKKYTEFCECDKGAPDDCCGPDVGEWSLRQRLIWPQPYLIDPNDYFMLICCLVENRYAPAKAALSEAEADLAKVGEQIASYEAKFKDGWVKNFETEAKAAIPMVIDCCDYEREDEYEQKPSRPY
jgi:hypothetical protein